MNPVRPLDDDGDVVFVLCHPPEACPSTPAHNADVANATPNDLATVQSSIPTPLRAGQPQRISMMRTHAPKRVSHVCPMATGVSATASRPSAVGEVTLLFPHKKGTQHRQHRTATSKFPPVFLFVYFHAFCENRDRTVRNLTELFWKMLVGLLLASLTRARGDGQLLFGTASVRKHARTHPMTAAFVATTKMEGWL